MSEEEGLWKAAAYKRAFRKIKLGCSEDHARVVHHFVERSERAFAKPPHQGQVSNCQVGTPA